MGKIRVKTLGNEAQEEAQKREDAKRRAQKQANQDGGKVKTPGKSKGGERVVSVEPSEAELEQAAKKTAKATKDTDKTTEDSKETTSVRKPRVRSKRYKDMLSQVDRAKFYEPKEAIELAIDTGKTNFKGSVEAHINLIKKAKELNLKNNKDLSISFEKKFPLAHAKLGAMSDKSTDLEKQLSSVIKFIQAKNITKVTVSSTMGPGVKVKTT